MHRTDRDKLPSNHSEPDCSLLKIIWHPLFEFMAECGHKKRTVRSGKGPMVGYEEYEKYATGILERLVVPLQLKKVNESSALAESLGDYLGESRKG